MHTLEDKLNKIQDKLETTEKDYTEMERKYQQILEEKSILAEQLQAEAELSAEAEEVRSHVFSCIFSPKIWEGFILLFCFLGNLYLDINVIIVLS